MKYLFSFLIISIFLSNIYGLAASAQESQQLPEAPKTLEEAKTIGERVLINFPGVLKRVWQEEALVIWQRLLNWFKNFWYSYIYPWLQNIWQKEVGIRKPEIKEEFEKEKQEMREEIPKAGKSLWQRFKELIK